MPRPRTLPASNLPLPLLAWLATAGLLALAWASVSNAAEPAAAEAVAFLRLVRDDTGAPLSLDTSIVRYRESAEAAARAGRREAVEVDLVGAVHVGSHG